MKRKIENREAILAYVERLRSMPQELKEEIRGWEEIVRSPYSYSFYSNKKKRWNRTPRGCYRVSNHWNFTNKRNRSKGVVHCRTNIPVKNHTYWTLAVFEKGIWQVIKSLPNNGSYV
ncbi:MAG: hypothetical protein AAF849_12140 [Bacteroidota bacterium]